jgi:GMP synthase (glutamine-hydrolysing)
LPGIALDGVNAGADALSAVRAGVDGVIISGSARDAWNEDPVNLELCELVGICRDKDIPVLGVCYGHQLLARALGGVVARHPGGLELGNTPLQLTSDGLVSPLFVGFPERFDVLSSHADAVLTLPPECELLAKGDFTLNQAFHSKNRFFGVQFHPETDPEVLRFIWSVRRDTWRSKVTFDLDHTLDNLRPAPMAANLLRNFVRNIIP